MVPHDKTKYINNGNKGMERNQDNCHRKYLKKITEEKFCNINEMLINVHGVYRTPNRLHQVRNLPCNKTIKTVSVHNKKNTDSYRRKIPGKI